MDRLPASVRFSNNPDAMLLLLIETINQTTAARNDWAEQTNYMHRQFQRLDQYNTELEIRMEAMEALISRLIVNNAEIVQAHAHSMEESREYDMTDIDRLLADHETDDEFDEFFAHLTDNLED